MGSLFHENLVLQGTIFYLDLTIYQKMDSQFFPFAKEVRALFEHLLTFTETVLMG